MLLKLFIIIIIIIIIVVVVVVVIINFCSFIDRILSQSRRLLGLIQTINCFFHTHVSLLILYFHLLYPNLSVPQLYRSL